MKQRARLITVAWGEPYIDRILTLTLPSILAPGNLPFLSRMFDCELIIVTEEAFFGRISSSSVFQKLNLYCAVRLVVLDDLVAHRRMYGMSLTFAFHRGFADLGDRMTNYFLVFFNADFIVADGSYRTLAQRMLAGERLIFGPSYCVNLEDVVPILRHRIERETAALTLPPREMAALVLAYRHNTIRAKTVNQRLFHIDYIEQFYWCVDDHTLIGHQMPVSLVCMKPERALAEMRTFWDYGLISEACPTTKPCVLDDSDDFLIMELRTRSTAREKLRLGWPTIKQIATTLSTFVTKDQKALGLYPLVLHSSDLPEATERAKKQLREFVDSIYRLMQEKPIDHMNHPYWIYNYDAFQLKRSEFLEYRSASIARSVSTNTPSPVSDSAEIMRTRNNLIDGLHICLSRWIVIVSGLLERLHVRLFGCIPFVRQYHPYFSILRPPLDLIGAELAKSKQAVLLVSTQSGPLSKFVRSFTDGGHSFTDGSNLLHDLQVSIFEEPKNLKDQDRLLIGPHGPFDLCVCEIDLTDLLHFREVFQRIRHLMVSKGRMVVFYLNLSMSDLHEHQTQIIEQATLSVGQSTMTFAGSIWTKWALTFYSVGNDLRNHYGTWGALALVALALCALPFSIIGNWQSKRRISHIMPRPCLSLTMDYRLF